MTSGTIPYGTTLQTQSGTRYGKTWSGGNGRTEQYGGKTRDKWNNYSCTIRSRVRNGHQVTYTKKPGASCGWSGNRTIPFSVPEPSPSISWGANDELKLQQRLLSKVKSHDFNLAVPLAEMGRTVSMVDSNLRKLGRAALALRRGDFATAARQLGTKPKTSRLKTADVSGRWLELQYGWMPLLSDVYESSKAFEAISNGPRKTTVRASVTKRDRPTVTGPDGLSKWETVQTYRKSIQYEMYEELSVGRQLGLADPASVLWELTPWSFVVDWFIPIGSYLENYNQIPKLRGRFLTTVFREATGPHGLRHTAPQGNCYYKIITFPSPETDQSSYVVMSRTVSSTLTPPLPRFKAAGAVHGNRVWNAIALAQQAFTGGKFRR